MGGCAPTHEFHAPPQEGAHNSGTFPRFSDRPEAEGTQLSPQKSQYLADELVKTAQILQQVTREETTEDAEARLQELRAQTDEVLRQIQTGNVPQTQP